MLIRSEGPLLEGELLRLAWSLSARPKPRPILEWCRELDMAHDATSATVGNFSPYPYQREPLEATESPDVRQVTIQAGQRLGKSQIWKTSLLKRIHDGGCLGMILYPSVELAADTNRDTVLPLLKTLPNVRRDLRTRGNLKKSSYHLPSAASIVYYSGSTPALSKTINFGVVDEVDFGEVEKTDEDGKNTSNITALKIRMKTHPLHLLLVVSSPTLYGGPVYQQWLAGSRGTWCLRCLYCGHLCPGNQLSHPMQDGTFRGLQWQKDQQGNVDASTIRYLCPRCGHAHVWADAVEMNLRGQYVHANAAKTAHRSFQVGALANPALWPWLEIAEAQEAAVTLDGRKYLRNTVLGMPYKPVAHHNDSTETRADVLKSRQTALPRNLHDRLSAVILGADTQAHGLGGAKYWIWIARGWDENGNSWLLGSGLANSLAELEQAGTATYHGQRPLLRMVDQGGFDNATDLLPFVAARPGWLTYKGEDAGKLKGLLWRSSDTDPRLILADAIGYQVRLLDAIYGPPRPSGHLWSICDAPPAEYLEQLAAVAPNLRAENGDAFGKWKSANARRDYFDCEKMALVALDVAAKLLPPEYWPRKNLPLFRRLEILAELQRRQHLAKTSA